MSTYNVKVAVKNGETEIHVNHGLTGGGHPHLFVRDSDSAAPVLAEDGTWPVGLPWSIGDRLRGGADKKGRVLAVWQELPGQDPVPIAVLAWHAHGTGPLYVFDAGHSDAVDAEEGPELVRLLFDVVLEAAAHPKSPVAAEWQDRLRWSQVAIKHAPHQDHTAYRRENLRRAILRGFVTYKPPPPPGDWTKGAWLGERVF